MAKCPNCERDWLWDWECDTFRLADGSECDETPGNLSLGVMSSYFCLCGRKLADWYDRPDGAGFENEPPAWKGIVWDARENSYQGDEP